MDAYRIAIREHGRRWQILELVFEQCEGQLDRESEPAAEASARFQMCEPDVREAISYWLKARCIERVGGALSDALSVSLTSKGIDEFTKAAHALLRKESQFPPVLILEQSTSRKVSPRGIAVLRGFGRFEAVCPEIGVRQALFLHMIFASKLETNLGDGPITVVSKSEVVREHERWVKLGAMQLRGKDTQNPENRVTKMWTEFLRQLHTQVPELKGLFHALQVNGESPRTYYGIALPAVAVKSSLWNLDRLLGEAGKESSELEEAENGLDSEEDVKTGREGGTGHAVDWYGEDL